MRAFTKIAVPGAMALIMFSAGVVLVRRPAVAVRPDPLEGVFSADSDNAYQIECFWRNHRGDLQRLACPEPLYVALREAIGAAAASPVSAVPGRSSAADSLGTIRVTFLDTAAMDRSWRVLVEVSSRRGSSNWDGRHELVAELAQSFAQTGGSPRDLRQRGELELARCLVGQLPVPFSSSP